MVMGDFLYFQVYKLFLNYDYKKKKGDENTGAPHFAEHNIFLQ